MKKKIWVEQGKYVLFFLFWQGVGGGGMVSGHAKKIGLVGAWGKNNEKEGWGIEVPIQCK